MRHGAIAAVAFAVLVVPLRAQYDSVTVIQCGPDTVVSQLALSTSPRPEFWNPVDNCVYLTTDWDGLFVLACENDSVVGQFDYDFSRPYALDTLDNKLYAPREGWPQWEFTRVDLSTRNVKVLFAGPQGIVSIGWSPHLNRLYCSNWNDTIGIRVFDCASDSELAQIPLHPARFGLDLERDKMCCVGLNTIYLYDLAGDSLLDTIPAPAIGAAPPEWNPVDGHFYVWQYGRLWVVDGLGDTLIDTVAVSGGPICLDTRDNAFYLRAYYGDAVLVFDCATRSVRSSIPDVNVDLAVYDSADNRVYAISDFSYDRLLTVIDCAGDSVIRRILLPTISSWGLCWNALMNRVYTGGNSMMHAVAEESAPRGERLGASRGPTILSGVSGVTRLASCVLFDAMGRRVVEPKPGVYFVREDPQTSSPKPQAVRKVIVTR